MDRHWGDGAGAESAVATGGFSWYTRIFDWVQEPYSINALSLGMGATWMQRVSNDPNTSCACPNQCCMDHASNNSKLAARGNQSCDWLMQSMEGGPGLGRTELPTTRTKWRIGDSVGCYSAYTGSPLFQFGQFAGHACSRSDETAAHPMSMAFIQLANNLVMFPDGITFAEHGQGMLGVAYVLTPFGKVNGSDVRNSWTVVLDSTSFSGPLGYFLPEFWAIRAPGMENATRSFPDFGTVEAIHMSGGAFEINSIPTFNSSGLRPGSQALRLPRMAMPLVDGRSVLFMGSRTFSKDEIYTPLEQALQAGELDASQLLSAGTRHPCVAGHVFSAEDEPGYAVVARAKNGGKFRIIDDCPQGKANDLKMAPFTFSRSIPGCQLGAAFNVHLREKTVDAYRLLRLTFLDGLTPHMGPVVGEPANDPFANHREKILKSGVFHN